MNKSGVNFERQSGVYQGVKRLIDVVASLTLITLTAPLWGLIALAIKLDTPGPILFRQRRLGLNYREFVIYKFRSMSHGASQRTHRESFREYAEQGDKETNGLGSEVKDAEDSRVTRIGKIIRRSNLDELPQLFNVLKGEMSLVGPRPAIPYELEWYKDQHYERFTALPGITGLWQVTKDRFQSGLEGMIGLDIDYIRKRSFLLDIWIMTMTIVRTLQETILFASKNRG